jgi:hypothetical protein
MRRKNITRNRTDFFCIVAGLAVVFLGGMGGANAAIPCAIALGIGCAILILADVVSWVRGK